MSLAPKRIRWVSRGEAAVLTMDLDAAALEWLVDHLPKNDDATKQLLAVSDAALTSVGAP
jgi:hypothetical protein